MGRHTARDVGCGGNGSSDVRTERLLLERIPLVKKIVGSLGFTDSATRDNGMTREDAFQAGCLGSLRAIETYDGRNDCSLDTHVKNCIRWEIMDELRRCMWGNRRHVMEFDPLPPELDRNASYGGYRDPEYLNDLEGVQLTDSEASAFTATQLCGMTLKEAGNLLGVTESRACQLVKQTRDKIEAVL